MNRILFSTLVLLTAQAAWSANISMTCGNDNSQDVTVSITDSNSVTVQGMNFGLPENSMEVHLASAGTHNDGRSTFFLSEYIPNPIESYLHMEVTSGNDNELTAIRFTEENFNGGDDYLSFNAENCNDPGGKVMAKIIELSTGKADAASMMVNSGSGERELYKAGVEVLFYEQFGTLGCAVDRVFMDVIEDGHYPSVTVKDCGVAGAAGTKAVIDIRDMYDTPSVHIPKR